MIDNIITKLEEYQSNHKSKYSKKLLFYSLAHIRWGHDLIEFIYANKHASKHNYDIAFIVHGTRNLYRLKTLSLDVKHRIIFIDAKILCEKFEPIVKVALIREWIKDYDRMKFIIDQLPKYSFAQLPKEMDELKKLDFYWPACHLLKVFIHCTSLVCDEFNYWNMNDLKYNRITRVAMECKDGFIRDVIDKEAEKNLCVEYSELNQLKKSSRAKNTVVFAMNVRNIFGHRNTRMTTVINTLRALNDLAKNYNIVLTIYASRIKTAVLRKMATKLNIQLILIDSYLEEWEQSDSQKLNADIVKKMIGIEQVIMKYSHIIISPESGAQQLPYVLQKPTIMVDAMPQISHFERAIYLPLQIKNSRNLTSSEIYKLSLEEGRDLEEFEDGNSKEQLLSGIQYCIERYIEKKDDTEVTSLPSDDDDIRFLNSVHNHRFPGAYLSRSNLPDSSFYKSRHVNSDGSIICY